MVMGSVGGVGAPGVSEPMRRFDGAVAAGALGVVCAFAFVPLVVLLLCAKALLAVHGNINKTPPNRTPFSAVVRNFIRTLFPAQCLALRAWL
jgi:hypothetical protein